MTLDHHTLTAVGGALYGPQWQSQLARDLGVAIRTMQRWAAGEFTIPPGVWPEIGDLCRARGNALKGWADTLK